MKCNVIFYSSLADKRVVDKTSYITKNMALEGNFREEVSLLNPIFQIECKSVPTFNYCYIDSFNRYYYVNSIKCIRNKLYEVSCSVDVLMTYKKYISNSSQFVSRQENKYNELLEDSYVTFNSDYDFIIKEQHLDFLDYANVEIGTSGYNDLTNIVLSTTANGVDYEV